MNNLAKATQSLIIGLFVIFFLILILSIDFGSADSQGAFNGTLFRNNTATGIRWVRPGNAQFSDNIYTNATISIDGTTTLLNATGFGFDVPSTATINGVVVEVEKKSNVASEDQDSVVQLIIGNGSVSVNNNADVINFWPTAEAYTTYGSPTDLWGQNLTPTIVNSSKFGMSISAVDAAGLSISVASIDHIRMTVYYTPASVPSVVCDGSADCVLNCSQIFSNKNINLHQHRIIINAPTTQGLTLNNVTITNQSNDLNIINTTNCKVTGGFNG